MRRPVQSIAVALLIAAAAPASASAAAPGDTLLASGLPGLAAPTPDLFGWNTSGRIDAEDSVAAADASQDGTIVVFATDADDLAPSLDTRGVGHVVVKNRTTGVLTPVTTGANGASSGASISDDGTRVAFVSTASNLTPSDPLPDADVFVKDLVSGVVTLISSPEADGGSIDGVDAMISGNGRFVAFESNRPLAPGDANARTDIFRRTIADGAIVLVSSKPGPASATTTSFDADSPSISDDGRLVTFSSDATDLVTGDGNGVEDVFVRDTVALATVRASAMSGGAGDANGGAGAPKISGNGRFVAFSSTATNLPDDVEPLPDVFRRHVFDGATVLASGPTVLISRATGATGASADAGAFPVAISDDGDIVIFNSSATNLGAGAAGTQPYARTHLAGVTTSLRTPGTTPAFAVGGSGGGGHAVLTAYGPLVAGAPPSAVYARPVTGGPAELLSARQGAAAAQPQLVDADQLEVYYEGQPQVLSADGRFLAFGTQSPALGAEVGGNTVILRRDMRTGEVVRASRTDAGAPAVGWRPSISADGNRIAFVTSTALVAQDADALSDAYVFDVAAGTVTLASRGGAPDAKANGSTAFAMISADGRRVLFAANATNLGVAGGTHLYLRDLASSTTQLVDRTTTGATPNQVTEWGTLSSDGSRVAFATRATNVSPDDSDASDDVYLRDLAAGTTTLLSRQDGTGTKGTSLSILPVISGDGTRVAFRSYAKNLDTTAGVLPPGTTAPQLFVRDIPAATTRLISRVGTSGPPSDAAVGPLGLDADGSLVAFELTRTGAARNLAPGAPGDVDAVVVRDIATGTQQLIANTAPDPSEPSSARGVSTPSLSADGRCVAFHARGYGFDPAVSPDFWQAWVRVLEGDCGVPQPVPAPPAPAGPSAPVATPPATAPRVTAFSMTNRRFRVGPGRTALSAATKRRRAKVGTTFRYTLSKAARVAITIERRTRGRRVGRTCRKATAKLRKRPSCVRYVMAGILRRSGRAGANRLAFSGRLGRKRLVVGSYRAGIVATDTAGRRSGRRTVLFTVVRR